MPTTASTGHTFDQTPELDGDMSRSDLVFVLQALRFPRKNSTAVVRLDKPVRDYLLRLLGQHG